MKGKRILTVVIACSLTFCATRAVIGLVAGDFAYSVIPGWHTITYPPEMTLSVLTAILLILTLMVVGLYKMVLLLTSTVLNKMAKGKD